MSRVEGKVAQILNSRELVVNIGTADGVREGMIFAVLGPEPLEVEDPDSGEVLDTVDREKVRVKAIEVRPTITICATYRTYSSAIGVSATLDLFKERDETLKIGAGERPAPMDPQESYVKRGDRVREVAR